MESLGSEFRKIGTNIGGYSHHKTIDEISEFMPLMSYGNFEESFYEFDRLLSVGPEDEFG